MFIGYKEVVQLEDFEPARPEYLGGSQDGPDPYAKYTMLFVTESGPDRRGTFAQVDKVMNSSSEYFALKRLRPMTMTGTLENDAMVGGRARDAFDEEYEAEEAEALEEEMEDAEELLEEEAADSDLLDAIDDDEFEAGTLRGLSAENLRKLEALKAGMTDIREGKGRRK